MACRMGFDKTMTVSDCHSSATTLAGGSWPGRQERSMVSENRFADSQTETPGFPEVFE